MRVYRRRYFGCGSWFRNDGGTGKRDKDFRCLERGCNSLEFSVGIKSRDGTICLNCIREKRKSSHEYLVFGIPCPVIRQRVAISVVEHPLSLPRARDRLDKREGKARYCHSVSRPGTNTRFEHFPAIRNEIEPLRERRELVSLFRSPFFLCVFFLVSLSLYRWSGRKAWRSSNNDILKGSSRACTHHEIPDLSANPSSAPSPKRIVKPRCGNSMLVSISHRDCSSSPFYSTIRIYETLGNGTALRGVLPSPLDPFAWGIFLKFESWKDRSKLEFLIDSINSDRWLTSFTDGKRYFFSLFSLIMFLMC